VLKVAAISPPSRGEPRGTSPQGVVAGSASMLYSFGDYTLNVKYCELRQAERPGRLAPHPAAMAAAMAGRLKAGQTRHFGAHPAAEQPVPRS
jgi:hypothetical protein